MGDLPSLRLKHELFLSFTPVPPPLHLGNPIFFHKYKYSCKPNIFFLATAGRRLPEDFGSQIEYIQMDHIFGLKNRQTGYFPTAHPLRPMICSHLVKRTKNLHGDIYQTRSQDLMMLRHCMRGIE